MSSFLLSDDFKPIYISPSERRRSESKSREKKIPSELAKPNLEVDDKTHLFFGKKVVYTGTFDLISDRTIIAKLIHAAGGDNNSSISGKTDFVIVGQNAGWAKMEKIQKLGIKTLNESEFLKLFDDEKFLDLLG